MGDSLITVVVIVLAAVLMFVFPLLTVSENSDNTSQLSVQNATTEFVENIRSTGKITLNSYDKYIQTINSTGNTFDVQMEVQVLDENPGVKTTQTDQTKIGENIYYTQYTTQVLNELKSSNKKTLKEGDIVTVKALNTNTTIAQTLRNFLYRIAGNNTSSIAASHSGIVTSNGSNK
jgi:hypothetical protein